MENLKQYLEADGSNLSKEALAMVNGLQRKIDDWGKTGAFKKSYVETLVSEGKRQIAGTYKKMQQAEALAMRERITEAKEAWTKTREKNANAYILSQQDTAFRVSLMTDDEVAARLAPLVDNRKPVDERIRGFNDYQEVQALHQRLVQGADKTPEKGKGNPLSGLLPEFRESVGNIEPFMFEIHETAIMDRLATELDNAPVGFITAERQGDTMLIPLDQLINDTDALAQLN